MWAVIAATELDEGSTIFHPQKFPYLVATGKAIADTQQEIALLLNIFTNTACQYERNGTMHDGIEVQNSSDWLLNELKYFRANRSN